MTDSAASRRIGFLGPLGSFTEQALQTQPDLRDLELVQIQSIPEVIHSTARGDVDLGFVAIENAIEGSVNATLDTLAFDTDLRIEREVVMAVHLCLVAHAGVGLGDIKTVTSIPVATAQCRAFLHEQLPTALALAANSTSEAVLNLAESGDRHAAAIGTSRAAELYGLSILADRIEDHPDNATRFVVVTPSGIPAPTGHDKTSIVVFQRADAPGSLLGILQEFAARNINLTRLESRPAKTGLGDYCFMIDLEGHLDDELVADALRTLKSKQADVKFLGSYPAAGAHGPDLRRDMHEAWHKADEWIAELRHGIQSR